MAAKRASKASRKSAPRRHATAPEPYKLSAASEQRRRDLYEAHAAKTHEATLAWAKQNGALRRAFDPVYDVLLSRGGAVAMLAVTDLSEDDGAEAKADQFRRAIGLNNAAKAVTLEQLFLAKSVIHGLEAALREADPVIWKRIAMAHEAMFTDSVLRRGVVTTLRAAMKKWALRHARGEGSLSQADLFALNMVALRKTHRKLVSIADEFGTLRAKTVRQVLHEKRLQPLGLAARLSMLCGAFGDGKSSPTEPDSTTFHRVKKNYENARDMNARLVVR